MKANMSLRTTGANMTKPFCIVSGIALSVSFIIPRLGIAETIVPQSSEQTFAQKVVDAPSRQMFAQKVVDAPSEAVVYPLGAQAFAQRVVDAPSEVVYPSGELSTTRFVQAAADVPTASIADSTGNAPPTRTFAQEFVDGFYSRIYLLGYGIVQDPVNSTLNPNNVLRIPRYQAQLDFRPDFDLNFRQFEFGIKPRFQTSWSRVQDGVYAGTDITTGTAYINEWIARYRVTNQLIVSYGRENLQWGPSQLLSPSNPFNQFNGKNNPEIEQPGLDYARIVVIPNSSWTLSMIANTGSGRLEQSGQETAPFHRAYAAKLDYTGDKTYFSVIASKRETASYRIGYFGGWTVSDALLAYSEGSVAVSHNKPTRHTDFDVLVGAAYTLESGPTITAEYFHHNNGCNDAQIAKCESPANIDPTNPLPRRDYALLQYVDTKLFHHLNLTVRLIQGINDHSTELISVFEYEAGQNWQLYLIPSVTRGPRSSEFGSLLRYSIFAGVGFTF
jgi:hypothetical protein